MVCCCCCLCSHVRYFVSKLDIRQAVSIFIYFTYMGMISIAFFLLTGSIGFFACLWFVRKIYGAIKVSHPHLSLPSTAGLGVTTLTSVRVVVSGGLSEASQSVPPSPLLQVARFSVGQRSCGEPLLFLGSTVRH